MVAVVVFEFGVMRCQPLRRALYFPKSGVEKLHIGISISFLILTGVAVGLMAFVTGSNPNKMLSAIVSWPVYVSSLYLTVQFMALALLVNLLNVHVKIRQAVGILISIFYGMLVTVIVADIMNHPDKIKNGLLTLLVTFLCIAFFDVLPKLKEHFVTPTKEKWVIFDKVCHGGAILLAVAANIYIGYKVYKSGMPLISSLFI
ncbi:hypothetical protein [Vibrio cholerae]|uniref:hypothetical protein n=1 Tax=Vibrio cholerae TaxID=666 RepID=UPI003967CED6